MNPNPALTVADVAAAVADLTALVIMLVSDSGSALDVSCVSSPPLNQSKISSSIPACEWAP
tara:strand:- start:183 stop:365 length:183 start_codon:yes stop_codon:yes gene_type:complete